MIFEGDLFILRRFDCRGHLYQVNKSEIKVQ